MIDFIPICASLLGIAYRQTTKTRHAEMLKVLAVRLRNAHDVLQRVTGGVAARRQNGRFWADLHKHGIPTSEVSATPRLRHPYEAFDLQPSPRAIRYALKALREDFEPRDVPSSEIGALLRWLEVYLLEEP